MNENPDSARNDGVRQPWRGWLAWSPIPTLSVERHGGRNWVASGAGKGPMSHFTLPG